MEAFCDSIDLFNEMYRLPRPSGLKLRDKQSLVDFADILKEEHQEVYEVISKYNRNSLDTATDLADWLGDIVVYCFTFARSNGIPLDRVLKIIMESNFSKLGSDGAPIYDERGKVLKGPEYWKPEPKICSLLGEVNESN